MAERNTIPNAPRTLLTGNEAPPQPQSQYYMAPTPVVTVVPNQLEQVLFMLRSLDNLGYSMTRFGNMSNAMKAQELADANEASKKNRIMLEGLGSQRSLEDLAKVDGWKGDWYGEQYRGLVAPEGMPVSEMPRYYSELTTKMSGVDPKTAGSEHILKGYQEKLVPALVDAQISLRTEQIAANRAQKQAYFVSGVIANPRTVPTFEEAQQIFGKGLTSLGYGDMLVKGAGAAINNGNNEAATMLLAKSDMWADPLDQAKALEALRVASIDKQKQVSAGVIASILGNSSLSTVDAQAAGIKLSQTIGFQNHALGGWSADDTDNAIRSIENIALDATVGVSERLAFLTTFASSTGYVFPDYTKAEEGKQPDRRGDMSDMSYHLSMGHQPDTSDWVMGYTSALPASHPVMRRVNEYIGKLQDYAENQHKADAQMNEDGTDSMLAGLADHITSTKNALTPEQISSWFNEQETKNGMKIPLSVRQAAFTEKSQVTMRQQASILIDVGTSSTPEALAASVDNAKANFKSGYITPEQYATITKHAQGRMDVIGIVSDFASERNERRAAYMAHVLKLRGLGGTVFDTNRPDAYLTIDESQGLINLTREFDIGLMRWIESPQQAAIRIDPAKIRLGAGTFIHDTYGTSWWTGFTPTSTTTSPSTTATGLPPP